MHKRDIVSLGIMAGIVVCFLIAMVFIFSGSKNLNSEQPKNGQIIIEEIEHQGVVYIVAQSYNTYYPNPIILLDKKKAE